MIEKTIFKTIRDNNLIEKNQHIVLGLSGGPDSVCLFNVLFKLSEEMNLHIHPVHINHKFRPGAAEADQQYVEDLCKSHGLICHTFVYDCNKLAIDEKISSEEAGRKVRYISFAQVASDVEAGGVPKEDIKIVVAQNADDQAETILFRILRGTGVDGVSGISYKRKDQWGNEVVRPLLDVYKKDILKYCKEHNLNPCIDHTNNEPIYTRNKIRLNLIPQLEQDFNGNIKEALIRLGKAASFDKAYMREQARKAFDESILKEDESFILLSGKLMREFPFAIRQRVISIALGKLGLDDDISFLNFSGASEIIDNSKPSARMDLPRGYYITKVYDDVKIAKTIPSKDRKIKVFSEKIADAELKPGSSVAYFDKEAMEKIYGENVQDSIVLRHREAGDYISLGKGMKKKIQDFFTDKKIPKDERDDIFLVGIGNEILWIIIPGEMGRYTGNYKVSEETKKIICIELISSI